MKILFVINSLEKFGGTERVATNLANNLANFHEITILSRYCSKNAYDLSPQVQDIKLHGSSYSFLSKVKIIIQKEKPKVVVVHTMSKLTPALLLKGVDVDQLWSLEHISYDFHSPIFQYFRKKLYNKLDKVITLTQADKKNYDGFHDDVRVIANATPLNIRFYKNNQDTEKIVLSVGRLTYQKGYDLLIKAWQAIEASYPDWQLHIYGDGEDKQKIRDLIKRYNLSTVRLMGVTPNIQCVYDKSSFYVLSSRFEGFGMVLIEAQSRGLPIVSFDCPSGPAEIVSHNQNGYLVEDGNIDELAKYLIKMIENESFRQQFSENALESVRQFSNDKITNQWLSLFSMVESKS